MINYLRNLLLKISAQALILQFCANLIIPERFNVPDFSYGECFLFCIAIMALTHNFSIDAIFGNTNIITKSLSDIALLQLNANTILIQKLDSINKNLEDAKTMKLDSIKSLDKPTMTPDKIAKKHNVSLQDINSQLEIGIKVEMEHTSDKDVAREIALDHLMELPDYYSKLKKVEHEDR